MTSTSQASGLRRPSLGFGGGACLAAAGFLMGLRPLGDNSFFTHLATGRLILDYGSVPTVDPYTFTAAGHQWVVQSWLASWLYATTEALTGAMGLRVLVGLTFGAVVALAWQLLRPAEALVVRLALCGLFVAVGGEMWAERPLMLGLIALACVLLAAEGSLDSRWLIPIGWLWVNVHGSFPLGLVYLIVAAVGRRLDGDTPRHEVGSLRWLALGVVLGALGPIGPKVLTFPLHLIQREDLLKNVVEWRSPTFDGFSQRLFLVQLALMIVLLVRRPTYRAGLVVAVFTVAALVGARNVPVTSLVVLPAMASAAPMLGELKASSRGRLGTALSAVAAVGVVLLGAERLAAKDFELAPYPTTALAFVEQSGLDLVDHHMAAPDIVGNYVELVFGARGIVFYDDRFDMFPDSVSRSQVALVQGGPGMRSALDDYDIDLVLWARGSALAQVLTVDPDWRQLYLDERWAAFCRQGTVLGSSTRSC